MKIKGVIWCLKAEDGKAQLRRMIESYKYWGVNVEKECWYSMSPMVFFDNGDIWKVRPAHESARGERCNISYIQHGIPFDFIDSVIMRCMCVGPFSAYRFFIGESMNEI